MNIFAGSISYTGTINTKDFNFYYLIGKTQEWISNILVYWQTDLPSSKDIIDLLRNNLDWEMKSYDISISTEDSIKLINTWITEWEYKLDKRMWKGITFEQILSQYSSNNSIVAIREAEISESWNRVIKIDSIV